MLHMPERSPADTGPFDEKGVIVISGLAPGLEGAVNGVELDDAASVVMPWRTRSFSLNWASSSSIVAMLITSAIISTICKAY